MIQTRQHRVQYYSGIIINMAAFILFTLAILPDITTGEGWLDIFRHFQYVFIWGFLACISWYVINRQWVKTLFLCLGLMIVSLKFLPFYTQESVASNTTPKSAFRVLQFNTWASNQHPDAIVKLIQDNKVDIIGLEEVNAINFQYLKRHLPVKLYPTFIHNPIGRICLLSKYPLIGNASISQHPPTILASLNIKSNTVRILLTHTSRPINNPSYASEIRTLISTIRQQQKPMIVLGDLNTTPWSNYFKQLTTSANLYNTQLGQDISPTYPSHLPKTQIYFPFPVLPLDHILVNPELNVIRRWNGPYSGSDHLPVLVDLAI